MIQCELTKIIFWKYWNETLSAGIPKLGVSVRGKNEAVSKES